MSKTFLSATSDFVYHGPNPVQERQGSTVTANLLTGGIDERFQRTDSTRPWSYLTTLPLGSPNWKWNFVQKGRGDHQHL